MIDIPKIALVGRPNVGKSTLFNRICGRRKAITDARPGSTRDRNYAQVSWQGIPFELVDTGGLLLGTADPLLGPAAEQAGSAIDEADRIVLVVDGRAGLLPDDQAIAARLRKGGQAGHRRRQQAEGSEDAGSTSSRGSGSSAWSRSRPSTATGSATCWTRRSAAAAAGRGPGGDEARSASPSSGRPERGQVVAPEPRSSARSGRSCRRFRAPRATRWTACSSAAATAISSWTRPASGAIAPAQGDRRPRERGPGPARPSSAPTSRS